MSRELRLIYSRTVTYQQPEPRRPMLRLAAIFGVLALVFLVALLVR